MIIFIVPAVLNLASSTQTDSTEHFTMAPSKNVSKKGWAASVVAMITFWFFPKPVTLILAPLFIWGLIMMLLPVKGFRSVTVDGDRLITSRLWVKRKTDRFDEIDRCVHNKYGYRLYRKGIFITAAGRRYTNLSNLEMRLRRQNTRIDLIR